MIIHLNGWPGSGKLTVARETARKLEARLLDNHTLHDVAGRLCDRDTPEYWELCYQVRAAAYGRTRVLPPHEVVVMTNALTHESDRDREGWAAVTLLTDDSVRSLTIDNTNRSPDQVADEIVGCVRRAD